MNNKRKRADCEYSVTQSPAIESEHHVEHSEFEQHTGQTDMGNCLDSSSLPSNMSEYSFDSYDAFFNDTTKAFSAEMESSYASILKMDEKEAHMQNEIMTKNEEMKNLSHVLRGKRDEALQAMGRLTATSGFKQSNAQK